MYFSRIAQARLEWRLNNVGGMKQLLDKCDPGRRGWEWHYLRNIISQSELLSVDVPGRDFRLQRGLQPGRPAIRLRGL